MVSPDRRWMVGRINNDQNDGTDRDASTQGSSPRAPGEKRGRLGSRSKRGPANRPFTADTPWPIDVDRQQSTPNQRIKNQNTKYQTNREKTKRSEKAKHGGPEKGQASDRCSLRRGMHDRCRAVEDTAEADRVGARGWGRGEAGSKPWRSLNAGKHHNSWKS